MRGREGGGEKAGVSLTLCCSLIKLMTQAQEMIHACTNTTTFTYTKKWLQTIRPSVSQTAHGCFLLPSGRVPSCPCAPHLLPDFPSPLFSLCLPPSLLSRPSLSLHLYVHLSFISSAYKALLINGLCVYVCVCVHVSV